MAFRRGDLAQTVGQILHETGVDPAGLELEITESLAMQRTEWTMETLREVKALGVQLAIDDFGTGYSSLGYLHRFPIDALKVDASFVSRLEIDPENREIVKTIVALAKNLRMTVVAEGVESAGQRAFLLRLWCEAMQGFLFAGPLDPDKVEVLLTTGEGWGSPRVAPS